MPICEVYHLIFEVLDNEKNFVITSKSGHDTIGIYIPNKKEWFSIKIEKKTNPVFIDEDAN